MIDVIVTMYNSEKTIKRCLDSLLSQSFKDFNILIIDDGSTDSSFEICKKLSKIDKRIFLYKKNNGGYCSAINFALKYIKSDYVMFLDPDDTLTDGCLLKLYNKIVNDNVDIVIAGFTAFDTSGKCLWRTIPSNNILYGEKKFLLLYDYWVACTWGKLYKKKIFNNFNLQTDNIYVDTIALSLWMDKASKISTISFSATNYMIHNDSLSHSSYDKNAFDIFYIRFFLLEFYKKKGFKNCYKKECNYLIYNFIPQQKSSVYQTKNRTIIKKYKKLVRKMITYFSITFVFKFIYFVFKNFLKTKYSNFKQFIKRKLKQYKILK